MRQAGSIPPRSVIKNVGSAPKPPSRPLSAGSRRMAAVRRCATPVRRRAGIIAVVAATAAFGSALGGRAAAEPTADPTPSETSPAPTDTPPPTATDTPPPPADLSPTDSSPTPDPSPTDPTPTTDPLMDATPTMTPTPSPSTDPTPTPTLTESPLPTTTPSTAPSGGAEGGLTPATQPSLEATNARSARERTFAAHAEVSASIAGTYSTASLDVAYRKLVKGGMSREVATRRIYQPFIVRGPAAWSGTWHAARYAGGFHLHEGQDVFCRYGAPVLATVAGRVEFDRDTLGGRIARLFMPDGGYWYYAHLSAWTATIDSGERVDIGEVIGHCGNSGDAIGAPPHIHFGHYLPSGRTVDPMSDLVGWLHAAERRVGVSGRPSKEATPPIVLPDYRYELGAEPTVPQVGSVVTVGLSAARRSAASSGTDALALALLARLLLIPGRRLARRLRSSVNRPAA
jgi:Peptidase family M23